MLDTMWASEGLRDFIGLGEYLEVMAQVEVGVDAQGVR